MMSIKRRASTVKVQQFYPKFRLLPLGSVQWLNRLILPFQVPVSHMDAGTGHGCSTSDLALCLWPEEAGRMNQVLGTQMKLLVSDQLFTGHCCQTKIKSFIKIKITPFKKKREHLEY